MIRTRSLAALAAASTLAATAVVTTLAAGPAHAVQAAEPRPTTLATGLVTPLSLALAPDGTRWFSQNFTGGLYRQRPGGAPQRVFSARKGFEVGAVSVRRGVVTFATTGPGGEQGTTRTVLWKRTRDGRIQQVARLGRHERRSNPDAATTYGFEGLDPACAAQVPAQLGPPTYTGTLDSHPYATATAGGRTYVADAAANAILAVSRRGRVSTVAVLPPVPVVITAEAAAANKMPVCVVGRTYRFEPVPTDVEVGPGGLLYVSTLPGGPEDGSTGAQGGISRVDPATGASTRLATGLVGGVGLAVSRSGDVYAASLFSGAIARLRAGTSVLEPYAALPSPGTVEISRGRLYATTKVLPGGPGQPPAGTLVRLGGRVR